MSRLSVHLPTLGSAGLPTVALCQVSLLGDVGCVVSVCGAVCCRGFLGRLVATWVRAGALWDCAACGVVCCWIYSRGCLVSVQVGAGTLWVGAASRWLPSLLVTWSVAVSGACCVGGACGCCAGGTSAAASGPGLVSAAPAEGRLLP